MSTPFSQFHLTFTIENKKRISSNINSFPHLNKEAIRKLCLTNDAPLLYILFTYLANSFLQNLVMQRQPFEFPRYST